MTLVAMTSVINVMKSSHNIFLLTDHTKMIYGYTLSVSTDMVNNQVIRYSAIDKFPSPAMGLNLFTIDEYATITVSSYTPFRFYTFHHSDFIP